MDNVELIIDTNFKTIDYCIAVEGIVNGYFNNFGEYTPHIGAINAMAIFYNLCVKQSIFDEEFNHDIKDLVDVDKLAENDEFISEYNAAINDTVVVKLNFGNAYKEALRIIDNKKSDVSTVINFVGELFKTSLQELSSLVSGDSSAIKSVVDLLSRESENEGKSEKEEVANE